MEGWRQSTTTLRPCQAVSAAAIKGRSGTVPFKCPFKRLQTPPLSAARFVNSCGIAPSLSIGLPSFDALDYRIYAVENNFNTEHADESNAPRNLVPFGGEQTSINNDRPKYQI
jgi:hypothetical protein